MKLLPALLLGISEGGIPDEFFNDADYATNMTPAVERPMNAKNKLNILATLESWSHASSDDSSGYNAFSTIHNL